MAATRQGFRINDDGDLRISGILSAGGFEVFNDYVMDYDTDLDIADGTVTLNPAFTIKQIHLMNISSSNILVSFGGAAGAGNQLLLVAGGAITLDLEVDDVRLLALADNAAYAYVLVGEA